MVGFSQCYLIYFNAQGLRCIPTSPMAALTKFFHEMPRQMSSHYWYHGILILVHYGNIYVLHVCKNIKSVFNCRCCKVWVADFSNTEARYPTIPEYTPCLPTCRVTWFECTLWIKVLVFFPWLFPALINKRHP